MVVGSASWKNFLQSTFGRHDLETNLQYGVKIERTYKLSTTKDFYDF